MPNFPLNSWRKATVNTLQLALLAILLSFYVLVIAIQIRLPAGTDYAKFYFSAYQALHGRSIYAVMDANLFGVPEAEFFQSSLVVNPPLHMPQVTVAYMPLALLPFAPSFWLLALLLILAGLVACTILWRVLYAPHASLATLVRIWLAFLAFFPTVTALRLGQGSLIFFLLATLVWYAARSGHSRSAGIALGLAVSLRTFGGVLIFYFLVKRQWRLLFWSAATFAVTVAAGILFVGLDGYLEWLRIATGLDIQARNWNASLAGFCARLLPSELALLATAFCSLLGLALLAWLSWPSSAN